MNPKYLNPTPIIDSDHTAVIEYAEKITAGIGNDPVEKAVALFYAARDDIRYDPYTPFYLAEHYKASNTLKTRRGFCVVKAAFLCALGRASGIPSRVGFADVRNHLATRQLVEFLGSDIFVFHGFTEFFLEGKWVKTTPTFNVELCHRHHVLPLEFNGREDAIFQTYSLEKKKFMEYLKYHGTFSDVPVDMIIRSFYDAYGEGRVKLWIDVLKQTGHKGGPDFYSEEIIL